MSKRVIIFIGPPGSGKGTQSELLGERLNLPKIDVGSVLRQRAVVDDKIGQTIHVLQNAGQMVPDNMLAPILTPIIKAQPDAGFILDGYCRNQDQVSHVIEWVNQGMIKEPLVINLNVDPESTLRRVKNRRFCAKCNEIKYLNSTEQKTCAVCNGPLEIREDDNVATYQKRIANYHRNAQPAQKELKERYRYLDIDGERTIESVAADILHQVQPLWRS